MPDADVNLSSNQESLEKEEAPTGPGTSTGIAPPMPTEEGGDLKSYQKKENEDSLFLPDSSSSSPQPSRNPDLKGPPPPADVVQNGYIEQVLDQLIPSKTMNSAPTDDNIEDFVRLLKPNEAVVPYQDRQKAELLRQRITKLLADAGIEMPPLLFFKHCLKHTDSLIADGKLESRPTSPNFFLIGHTGPHTLEHCINQLRGENRAHTDKQRTENLLQEMHQRKAAATPPSGEAKKKLDKLLGR
jgi:hypothetical protein